MEESRAARFQILNENQIKYILILAMIADHIAWAFVPKVTPQGQILHFIGRLTGPGMAYFLALETKSVVEYAPVFGSAICACSGFKGTRFPEGND